MATTVTSKGQVTIPKPVRDRLGIKPGSAVDFELEAGWARRPDQDRPPSPEPAGSRRLRGRAGTGLTTDEIMALTRGRD